MGELKKTIADRAIELILSALVQIAVIAGALWVNSKISEYRIDTVEQNLKEQASIVKELAESVKRHEVAFQVRTEKLDNIIRRIDVLETRFDRLETRQLNGVKP